MLLLSTHICVAPSTYLTHLGSFAASAKDETQEDMERTLAVCLPILYLC